MQHTHSLMFSFVMIGANHRSAQILLLLVIPGQLIFIYTIHLMKGGHTFPSLLLTIAFLSASLIQVSQTRDDISLCRHHHCYTINFLSCLLGLLSAVHSGLFGPLALAEV